MKKIISFFLALLVFTNTLYAGIGDAIDDFVDSNNILSNISEPRSFKVGNRMGYFGGSASIRIDTSMPPLASFNPPDLRVSCSGLDFNAGFISILNLDMIEQLLQQGGASLTWGLLIGLGYSLPTVSHVFEQIQKYVRMIQQLSGNLCALGKNIGQSIATTIQEGYKQDKSAREIASGAKGTFVETISDFWNNPDDYSKRTRGNIVYDAVVDAGMSADYAYLAMSLFGTMEWFPGDGSCNINEPEKADITVSVKPPLVKNIEDFKKYIYGGEIQRYSCGNACAVAGFVNSSCNNISVVNDSNYSGIKNKFYSSIKNVVQKIANGEIISSSDYEVVALKAIPNSADLFMYLATNYIKDPDLTLLQIDVISEYYAWWIIEALSIYADRAVNMNVSTILSKHNTPNEATKQYNQLVSQLTTLRGDIHKYFEKTRQELINFMNNIETFDKLRKQKSLQVGDFVTGKFNQSLSKFSF